MSKDAIEYVVCANGADYFAQSVESMPDFSGEEFVTTGADECGGCR